MLGPVLVTDWPRVLRFAMVANWMVGNDGGVDCGVGDDEKGRAVTREQCLCWLTATRQRWRGIVETFGRLVSARTIPQRACGLLLPNRTPKVAQPESISDRTWAVAASVASPSRAARTLVGALVTDP
jgi:hypothetical protein